MRTKTLIILVLAGLAQGQSWPSGAISDPLAGGKPVPVGHLRLVGFGAQLSNDVWEDNRMGVGFEVGLADGLALSAASGNRAISGLGAFQHGP